MQNILPSTAEVKISLFEKNFSLLLLAALALGLVLPAIGTIGRLMGLGLFGAPLLYALYLRLTHRQRSYEYFFILGFFATGEIFFRDFALVIVPFGGYLFVLYIIIILALSDLDALIALTRNRKFTGTYGFFLLFVLWTAISIVFSSDPYKGRWFTTLDASIVAMMGIALAYGMSKKARLGLLQGGLIGAMLLAGVTLGIARSTTGTNSLGEVRLGDGWVSAVQIATILSVGALAYLIYFYEYRRFGVVPIVTFGMTLVLLFITYSRGPLAALMVGASVYLVLRGSFMRGLVLSIILGALGIFVFIQFLNRPIDTRPVTAEVANSTSLFQKRFVNLDEATNRLPIWDAAIHIWLENPIAGVGVGGWFNAFADYTGIIYGDSNHISDAHNMILQAAAEGGLLAVVPLLIALIALIVVALKRRSVIGLTFISWAITIGLVENWKVAAITFALGAAVISIWLEEYEGKDTFQTRAMMARQINAKIKADRAVRRRVPLENMDKRLP